MGPPNTTEDRHWMKEALALAAQGEGAVEPNPMVGCILVKDGREIGRGYHVRFGKAHAEVNALRSLDSIDEARGATAYVTLEPCCHQGKTPPCSEALVDAGIRRVVVAMRDPFPEVDGGGIGRLKDVGIDVVVGERQEEAEQLNAPYLKRLRQGRPWVIAKWAMTVDGRIATVDGESQWITGSESRAAVHRLRARVDAVADGMGTVMMDDPMLNARLPLEHAMEESPHRRAVRTIYCRHRLPSLDSKLVLSANDWPVRVFASPEISAASLTPLSDAGVVCTRLQSDDARSMITESLDIMGSEDMTNVMLEGGAQLLGSFLGTTDETPLIDEFHVFIGPKLFGGASAPGPIGGQGIGHLSKVPTLQLHSMTNFGNDARLIYRRRVSM